MIDIRTVHGKLGEREYEIREAGFSASKVWKKRLMAEVKPLFNTFSDAPNMTFETPADLMNLFPLVESIFVDGIETIFDLLIEYAPALKADREYIETYATDHQIVSLFREVVLLTDPFGIIAQLSPKIGPGSDWHIIELAISQWGVSIAEAVSLSEVQVEMLFTSYLERKKFEAKITLSILSEALKPKQELGSLATLGAIGFGIQGLENLH